MKIYLDTNVFISLINEEVGLNFRGLNIEARDFFERVSQRGDTIYISDLFLLEAHKILHLEKKEIISKIKNQKVNFVILKKPNRANVLKFQELGIHHPDCIHTAIAFENCDCIITFNLKDFGPAKKFIPIFSPDDF
ncbi:MAG: type II toxin-antitoxin system VapC family toxin [Candidatus Woesearchaeota archaeon]